MIANGTPERPGKANAEGEKRPTKRLMPLGKQQFGIIVPTAIHEAAKHLAVDLGCRVSDVYARGVQKLVEEWRSEGTPGRSAVPGREITEGIAENDMAYLKALAAFLRSRPDEYKKGLLKALLAEFMAGAE